MWVLGRRPLAGLDDAAVIAAYQSDPLVHDRISARLLNAMLAAISALHSFNVGAITVAVPVLSREAREKVAALADAVICLQQPEPFDAVGQWYADFRQVGIADASALLVRAHRLRASTASGSAVEHSHSH